MNKNLRFVFDTNTLVSALLFEKRTPEDPAKSPFQKTTTLYTVMWVFNLHYMLLQARTPALQKRLFAESSLLD